MCYNCWKSRGPRRGVDYDYEYPFQSTVNPWDRGPAILRILESHESRNERMREKQRAFVEANRVPEEGEG